jgi:hypothetical protein
MLSRSAARKAAAGEPPPKTPQNAALGENTAEGPPPLTESLSRAVHISLRPDGADDEKLRQLRDYLSGNAGSCPVFIHIAVPSGEKVIRTLTGLGAAEDENLSKLGSLDAVARAWRE